MAKHEAPGRAPHWWEKLLHVIPSFHNIKGAWVMHWLGGIAVLRRPRRDR